MIVLSEEGVAEQQRNGEAKTNKTEAEDGFKRVYVGIDDVPPIGMTITYAIQHYVTMFGWTVIYPFLIGNKLCLLRPDDPARGYLISTTLVVSGITTLIQTSFGTRLPIIQGPCYTFLPPTLAILSMAQWDCPQEMVNFVNDKNYNNTNGSMWPEEEWTELWQSRMREVQGGLLVGSVVECLLGLTGAVGFLMQFVGPITAAPIIMLIGCCVMNETADSLATNMPIAVLTVVLMVIFTQHMEAIPIPIPCYSRANGFRTEKFYIFKTFPVLLCVGVTWVLCVILTSAGVLSENSAVRTDANVDILARSDWIRIPYPGQWGMPTISSAGVVLGFIAGALCSVLESVSDYFSCARISSAPSPPSHALNRGILFEGLGGILASFFGAGCALTSYSCNIATISVTKVASRRVVQVCGVMLIILGAVGKLGALLSLMPQPVMGGLLSFMSLVIVGVGLELVQFVDLNRPRNAFIVGSAIFWGLVLPVYVRQHPNDIATGVEALDQTFKVLCSTNLFVAGFVALLLDNTIPGTREERGIDAWLKLVNKNSDIEGGEPVRASPYDFPIGMGWLKKHSDKLRWIPVLPVYKDGL